MTHRYFTSACIFLRHLYPNDEELKTIINDAEAEQDYEGIIKAYENITSALTDVIINLKKEYLSHIEEVTNSEYDYGHNVNYNISDDSI